MRELMIVGAVASVIAGIENGACGKLMPAL